MIEEVLMMNPDAISAALNECTIKRAPLKWFQMTLTPQD
jgi:hypothetical protein